MLIEFRVANYRSFHDTQTLSFVASKDQSHIDENCSSSGLSIIPNLLRSAVLYGPNASGKTNLIFALAMMRDIVERSAVAIREGEEIEISPFLFKSEARLEPSEFEVTYVENGIRYQYGFSTTKERIIKEWLFVYLKGKPQRWFLRDLDEKGKEHWYFGPYLLEKHRHQIWKDSTRSNALFLSTAVNLNCAQLRPIYFWFVDKLMIIFGSNVIGNSHTLEYLKEEASRSKILEFLQAADLGIKDIEVKTEKKSVTFFHSGGDEPIGLDFKDESHGTQRLFSYAGPMLDVLSHGKILVIDELDSSLHPQMMQFLIKLIHSDLNQNNAQLIFTTHNTSLLDTDLFRRDQIWFMEKDQSQASRLYPLSDFSPRKGEALEKGYLIGRYGALPFFGEMKL